MKTLLTLIVTPALEQALTDWLLIHPRIDGFTTHAASGHGSHHALTISEQVTGQRKQLVYWLELEPDLADEVLAELRQEFAGSQIHYWKTALTGYGTFD